MQLNVVLVILDLNYLSNFWYNDSMKKRWQKIRAIALNELKKWDAILLEEIPKQIQNIFKNDSKKTNIPSLGFASNPEEIESILENISKMTDDYLQILAANEEGEVRIWGDLFYEIEQIINYFIDLSRVDRDILNPFYREFMKSFYYHKQMANFLYLFSTLDKITTLLNFSLSQEDNYDDILLEIKKDYKLNGHKLYFDPHFLPFSKKYVDNELLAEFVELIKNIYSSTLWKFLKDIRNQWGHNYSAIYLPNNIGLMITILYPFVLRICVIIKTYYIPSNSDLIARKLIDYIM
ncbi:hypothetical protein [Spiroplasma sp. DGKH1]|uniref:hypothetical protein n=1 Tax=Spiroplasma sp. DGKH1 TaxID=3050074 RepID=UPI0034C656DE